jgi:hypothetical protein
MKDDTKNELTRILGLYDDRLAEAARAEAAKRAAELAFPGRYAALRSNAIRPALQEFADILNGRGHEVTVRELEESTSSEGGVTLASIALRIAPKTHAASPSATKKSFVEISFSANRNERRITVSSTNTMISSAGSVGKRGDYNIEEVTPEVIEGHVLQTLRDVLAG